MPDRLLQVLRRLQRAFGPGIGAGGHSQRPPGRRLDDQVQRRPTPRPTAGERLPQSPRQPRIVGLPHLLAGQHLAQVDAPAGEGNLDNSCVCGLVEASAVAKDSPDAAALRGLIARLASKDHAVASRQRRGQLDGDAATADLADAADTNAAVGRAFAGD